jgi:hypothetical protein
MTNLPLMEKPLKQIRIGAMQLKDALEAAAHTFRLPFIVQW